MWTPKTEAEITQAIATKSIEETSIFDAKRGLGANNKEIAKDIAAMANASSFRHDAAFQKDDLTLHARKIALEITSLLAFAGKLYNKTQYMGMIDICLALNGLRGACLDPNSRYRDLYTPYEQNQYRRTKRISAISLEADFMNTAKTLFSPLMEAMSQGSFEPFAN